MYFSVITPEVRLLRQAAHNMAQPAYVEHQWLWRFFPSSEDQKRDFIFRRHEVDRLLRFYVVSQRKPVAFNEAWGVQSKQYAPQLEEGQSLSFQLCANPVVAKKNEKGEQRRHDVVMHAKRQLLEEHRLSKWSDWKEDQNKPLLYELVQKNCEIWLDRIGTKNGFEIACTDEEEPRRLLQVDGYQQKKAGKRNIIFSTVDFSGKLVVTDPALFQQALFNGLGHAKAFGCGLLMVKRMES